MSPVTISKWTTLPLDRTDTKPWDHRFSSKDRLALRNQCGDNCFVMAPLTTDAQKLSKNASKYLKFPVCRVPSSSSTTTSAKCTLSPSGILAANRRARLTRGSVSDKYDAVVESTSKYINEHHITLRSKQTWPIQKVTLYTKPTLAVSIVYANGETEPKRPLSARTIQRTYGKFLTPSQRQKLASFVSVK